MKKFIMLFAAMTLLGACGHFRHGNCGKEKSACCGSCKETKAIADKQECAACKTDKAEKTDKK